MFGYVVMTWYGMWWLSRWLWNVCLLVSVGLGCKMVRDWFSLYVGIGGESVWCFHVMVAASPLFRVHDPFIIG